MCIRDRYIENLLVVPVGEDIVLQLESRDVIHSFFVAELRLKQDIVPGKTQFAWFNPIRPCEVDILCTELCGWGHYKMKARLKVVPRNEFDTWLKELKQEYQPQELAGENSANVAEVARLWTPYETFFQSLARSATKTPQAQEYGREFAPERQQP